MLTREEFNPFTEASSDDVLKAHVLLSEARNVKPKNTVEAALDDLEQYRLYTHGTSQRPPGFSFYKDRDRNVVGMTYTTEFKGSSTLKLEALAIDKAHRQEGYGAKILDDVISTAKRRELGKVSLAVRANNKIARRLYESRDFAVTESTGTYEEMLLEVA